MTERKKGIRLGAALFNADHGKLAKEVARLEAAGLDFIHLDVYDGHFVSDLGFPPQTISALRPLTILPFEVHLGAIDPIRFVPRLAEAGTDLVIFHIESIATTYEAIFKARMCNVKVGLALTLGTPLARLEPVITLVDTILLLSRVTGEGTQGASFDPLVLPRIRGAREIIESAGAEVDIQVAGGIKPQHIPDLISAGATSLTLGGSIYRVPDMAKEVAKMRSLASRKKPSK